MAQVRINKAALLHLAKKVGHHALGMSKAFGEFFQQNAHGITLSTLFAFAMGGLAIWEHFHSDVQPPVNVERQVAAVVRPESDAILADNDKGIKTIIDNEDEKFEHLSVQFSAQNPKAASQPPPPVPTPSPPLATPQIVLKSIPPLPIQSQQIIVPTEPKTASMVATAASRSIRPRVVPVSFSEKPISLPTSPIAFTKETPVVVISDSPDDHSQMVAEGLSNDLRAANFNVTDNRSQAAFFIKVQGVKNLGCPYDTDLQGSPSGALNCTTRIDIIVLNAQDTPQFGQSFIGVAPESSATVRFGSSDSIVNELPEISAYVSYHAEN